MRLRGSPGRPSSRQHARQALRAGHATGRRGLEPRRSRHPPCGGDSGAAPGEARAPRLMQTMHAGGRAQASWRRLGLPRHCGQSATRTVASGTCRMELQVHDGATRGGHAQACCCSGGRHPAVPSTRGPKEGRAGPTVSFMASPWALPFMPSPLSRWSRERPLHEGEEGAGVTSRRCRGRQGGSRRGG